MGYTENILVCLNSCNHSAKVNCARMCEGRLVRDRAREHDCPLAKFPARGLGDVVAKITTAMGITPCDGCEERKEILNAAIPFKRKGGCGSCH